jgi:hypothetical protein
MDQHFENQWFFTEREGGPRLSKFLRENFTLTGKSLEVLWLSWTPEEKLRFAGAFAARRPHSDDDFEVLEFLMHNGDSRVWSTIAIPIARHRDHKKALAFLVERVSQEQGGANYYQALGLLSDSDCVPLLRKNLLRHRQELDQRPLLKSWNDRFVYLDFLTCSATLFLLTEEEEYRNNIREMLQHTDVAVKRMARTVAGNSGIDLGPL